MNRKQNDSESENKTTDEYPRIRREKRTIEAMIKLYCKHHHEPQDTICRECKTLLEYARKRLDKCPFQEKKPTCSQCTIHCYEPEQRETIREIMRYSGPRMIVHHPIMAIKHLVDKRKNSQQ